MTTLTPAQLAERAVDAAKEIEALHARAEAQVAALREALVRCAVVHFIEPIFDNSGFQSIGRRCFYRCELCNTESETPDAIKHDGSCALSSLPASPATEKLQARVKELEGALKESDDALRMMIDDVGVRHEGDCPEDDTCRCVAPQIVNYACRRATSALKGEG